MDSVAFFQSIMKKSEIQDKKKDLEVAGEELSALKNKLASVKTHRNDIKRGIEGILKKMEDVSEARKKALLDGLPSDVSSPMAFKIQLQEAEEDLAVIEEYITKLKAEILAYKGAFQSKWYIFWRTVLTEGRKNLAKEYGEILNGLFYVLSESGVGAHFPSFIGSALVEFIPMSNNEREKLSTVFDVPRP